MEEQFNANNGANLYESVCYFGIGAAGCTTVQSADTFFRLVLSGLKNLCLHHSNFILL